MTSRSGIAAWYTVSPPPRGRDVSSRPPGAVSAFVATPPAWADPSRSCRASRRGTCRGGSAGARDARGEVRGRRHHRERRPATCSANAGSPAASSNDASSTVTAAPPPAQDREQPASRAGGVAMTRSAGADAEPGRRPRVGRRRLVEAAVQARGVTGPVRTGVVPAGGRDEQQRRRSAGRAAPHASSRRRSGSARPARRRRTQPLPERRRRGARRVLRGPDLGIRLDGGEAARREASHTASTERRGEASVAGGASRRDAGDRRRQRRYRQARVQLARPERLADTRTGAELRVARGLVVLEEHLRVRPEHRQAATEPRSLGGPSPRRGLPWGGRERVERRLRRSRTG